MPYIGRDLNRGNYLKLDDISSSFNSSTQTFNLTVGGSAFTPGSAFAILVSVGGVIQEPESAYQVSNSEITFANAPTAQDSFFCIALGVALGIGVPGNGTVNGTQMAKPFNYDGFFYLNDSSNRVGINSSIPTAALDVDGIIKASSFTGGSGGINVGVGTFTGLDVNGNGDVSGNFVIGGDLTVNGTTSTIDTNLIGVDRVEVGANSSTIAGIAVTQSGTADILNLYDGSTEVFSVADGGAVTATGNINIDADNKKLQIGDSQDLELFHNGTNSVINNTEGALLFQNNGSSSMYIASDGQVSLNNDITFIGASANALWDKSENYFSIPDKIVHSGDTNTAIRFPANDTFTVETGGNERLQITGSSVKTLNAEFLVEGDTKRLFLRDTRGTGNTARPGIWMQDSASSNQFFIGNGSSTDTHLEFRNITTGDLVFKTNNNTERVRILSNGKVGIGTDNPNARLRIHHDSDDSAIVWLSGADVTSEYLSLGIQSGLAVLRGGGVGSTNCALSFETSTSGTEGEKMRLDANGILKIGDSLSTTHVTQVPSGVKLFVNSQGSSYGGQNTQAIIFDSQTAAVDAGGTLTLAGFSGTQAVAKALIKGGNEGSASTNAGYFAVFTRPTSGVLSEKLRITSDGKIGINQSTPTAELEVCSPDPNTTSTLFIHTPKHNTNVASEAILKFGYGHSGSPDGVGHIKMVENANNSFDGDLKIALPFNNGSGGSVTTERIHLDGTYGRLGLNSSSFADTSTALVVRNGRSDSDHTMLDIICNDNETARIMFSEDSNHGKGQIRYTYTGDGNYMSFYTNGTASGNERLRITSDGKFSLGTSNSSPSAAVHIDYESNNLLMLDSATGSTQKMFFAQNGATHAQIFGTSASGALTIESDPSNNHSSSYIDFRVDGGEKLRITSTGQFLFNSSTVTASYGGKFHLTNTNVAINSFANNQHAQTFMFAKSRGTTGSGGTIVQDNDFCGHIEWYADDGVDTANQIAKISGRIDGTPGTDNTPGELIFHTTPAGANASTERVRITASGDFQEKSDGTNWYNVVTGYDIGTNPNEIPINQMLGGMAYMDPTNYEQVYEIPSTNAEQYGIQSTGGAIRFGTFAGGCPDRSISWPDDTSGGNPIDLWVIDIALHCTGVSNSGRNDLYFKMTYNNGSSYVNSTTEWNNWILARTSYGNTSAGWNQVQNATGSTWGRAAVYMDANQYVTGHIILFRGGAGGVTRPGLMWDFNYTHGGAGATRALGSAHALMGNDGNNTRQVASLTYDLDAETWNSNSQANSQNIAGFIRQRGYRLQ